VRQDTSKRDSGADERVKFLVAADGELQMARGDALDLQVLCCVAREFEDFGREIFEDGGEVDGCLSTNSSLLARDCAKMTLYATAWKLIRRDESVVDPWMALL
jgi:hypothetical protein